MTLLVVSSQQVMPGDNTTVTLELHTEVVLEKGNRFALREGGRTVASGVVTKVIDTPKAVTGKGGKAAGKPGDKPAPGRCNRCHVTHRVCVNVDRSLVSDVSGQQVLSPQQELSPQPPRRSNGFDQPLHAPLPL